MENVIALILAAGKGTRMKSHKTKMVHKIFDKELVKRVVDTTLESGINDIVVIAGYQKELVEEAIGDKVKYAYQEEMLGTGHAVMQARDYLENKNGKVIILCGDVPLISKETIINMVNQCQQNNEYATVLTANYDNPSGYGRIIRDKSGRLKEIIEEKDAKEEQKKIKEINAGVYCFDIKSLLTALESIKPNNNQNEYYLPDAIKIMNDNNLKIGTVTVNDNTEILGVNNKKDLELLTNILKRRINNRHMQNGVIIENAETTYIYDDVKIGEDTIIHPNTIIKSGTIIGKNCELGPNAYIRENCLLEDNVKIGSFTEIKNTQIGHNTKVPHLSYLGDAIVGSNTNIGCGTITCNYDGLNKNKTIIGNNCFIGSNVNLIAPVTISDNVTIAAGSTITDDVPRDDLAIARARQVNKEHYKKDVTN